MNYLLVATVIVLVIFLTTHKEGFGMAGYTAPVGSVKLDDPRPDLSMYEAFEASVDNDRIQEFVLLTNEEITRRTGICNYIIETTSIKAFRGENNDVYECMFMAVKNSGFAFGFSVVASFEVSGTTVRLVSLRTQPIHDVQNDGITPFVEGSSGKEFVDYKLVKEVAVPTRGEFDSVKIKLQSW